MAAWTAVVLTGGRGSRLGRDKSTTVVGGRTLLARVLASVRSASAVVVVGPQPADCAPGVLVVREDPPGTGPAAALAAALPSVGTDVLVVLATDLPFLGDTPRLLAEGLSAGPADCDALLAVDRSGRRQPLCAAYRTASLHAAAAALPTVEHSSMQALLAPLRWRPWTPPAASVDPTMDIDTPGDLARARSQGDDMMQDWIAAVQRELGTAGATGPEGGLDDAAALDVDVVLDVAKDVAHQVLRPAAPVTTYLLGVAVGAGMPLPEAAARLRALAAGWTAGE
jgi:molybdopterin-guanine dinucleotide biosynthesis protein A